MKSKIENKLEELEKVLKKLKPLLKEKYRVKEIGIFGSYLRGEEKSSSDLDLLVEFSRPVGLFDFLRLEDFLTQRLGVKVDLVMKNALKPRLKDRIIKEAVYVWSNP